MIDDPIVEEVRQIRQEHAARFDYDLKAIFADLKQSETNRDKRQSPLLPSPEPNSTIPPEEQGARFARFGR